MTKMEGEDRMLAEFMTTLFSQRYPDLERESIHSYVAIRRHHVARLKKARRWHWGRDLSQDPRYLGQAVTTPCTCSCVMCRPRKYSGDTMQERKAMLDSIS